MKSTDKKAKFVELRASGKSYRSIADELKISKSTCERWEKELREEIEKRQDERMEELYLLYGMDRASRIKRLGETLQSMESALQSRDLEDVPADALLKMILKYHDALKAEYSEPTGALQLPDQDGEDGKLFKNVIKALASLYEKQERGEVSPAQVKAQITTLQTIVSTHNMKIASDCKWW